MTAPPNSVDCRFEAEALRLVLGQGQTAADRLGAFTLFVLLGGVLAGALYATWSSYTPLIAVLALVSLLWTAALWRELRRGRRQVRLTPRRVELSSGATLRLEDVERVEQTEEGVLLVKAHHRHLLLASPEEAVWLVDVISELVGASVDGPNAVRDALGALRAELERS